MPSALARIQLRQGTSTDWTAANTLLESGEPGVELDTLKFKIGDGIRYWSALPYAGGPGGTGGAGGAVTSVNSHTGAVVLIPEDVPGLATFIAGVVRSTLVAGANIGITSNIVAGTITIASGGAGGAGGGVVSINGLAGAITLDGLDGIVVTQTAATPAVHVGVQVGGLYGGGQALPGAPLSVTADPSDSLALVSWQPPVSAGATAITSYIVQRSSDFGMTWITAPSSAADLSTTVSGLTNGTGYRFRVAAVSSTGTGPFSAPSGTATPFAPTSIVTGVALSGNTLVSGDAIGTVVGTISAVPPSVGGVTFTLPASTPGNASFEIAGTTLRTTDLIELPATPSVLVSITATDPAGTVVTQDFTITIDPAHAVTPPITASLLSSSSVSEDAVAGTAVGLLTPVPSWLTGVTYSLLAGGDNAYFAITGRSLSTSALLPTAVLRPTLNVTVRATDAAGYAANTQFAITVVPIPPLTPVTVTGMLLSPSSVDEGTVVGTTVGTITPVPAGLAGVTYTLPGNVAENANFAIVGTTLRTAAVLAASIPSRAISIRATDLTGHAVTVAFVVTVVPVAAAANVVAITRQPVPTTAVAAAAAFSVTATSSTNDPLTYQWQVQQPGASLWVDIPAATTSDLALTGLSYADNNGRYYRVIVSSLNAVSLPSDGACLGVQPDGWVLLDTLGLGEPVVSVFPVADGVMVVGDTSLTWTADGRTYDPRLPTFASSFSYLWATGAPAIGAVAAIADTAASTAVGRPTYPWRAR